MQGFVYECVFFFFFFLQFFVEIALSGTVIEINAFLHFTQKFMIAAKMAGTQSLGNSPEDSADTLRV